MRILPSTLKAVLERDYARTHDVVEITIPAQVAIVDPDTLVEIVPASPEVTLRLASAEGITLGGYDYVASLRSVGNIKFSLGRAPDNADVVIENVSRSLGFVLTDTRKVLDGSKAVIKKAFQMNDGSYEAYPLFYGYVRDVKVDQESISMGIISDMSRVGSNVGNRTVTQRCIWVFNKQGSGIGRECGWQTSQTGDPNYCDYGLDTAKGCTSHSNTHRFGGVPAFTATPTNSGYDANRPWPFDIDNPTWCVSLETNILCFDPEGVQYWMKAKNVQEGETLVSIDKFGKKVKVKVLGVGRGSTSRLYNITTKKGFSLECSPSHPIMEGFGRSEGRPAYVHEVGDKVLVYQKGFLKAMEDRVVSIEAVDIGADVVIFNLEEPNHTFVTGKTEKGGIVSHNLKREPYETRFDTGGFDFNRTV